MFAGVGSMREPFMALISAPENPLNAPMSVIAEGDAGPNHTMMGMMIVRSRITKKHKINRFPPLVARPFKKLVHLLGRASGSGMADMVAKIG